jgi:hypothetical protein
MATAETMQAAVLDANNAAFRIAQVPTPQP